MLIVTGTNHKYSPIEFRERIAFSKKRIAEALTFLKEYSSIKGAVILSTCNRVEIYADVEEPKTGLVRLEDFLTRYHEIEKDLAAPYLYRYIDKEAARHLFEVACGLDSQVLGETEILGQVRFFYEEAKGLGFTDSFIESIFNKAIKTGRFVRLETKISEGRVSIGNIAIELIRKEAKDLCKKKVLIIGVGKISKIVAKNLLKEGGDAIFVSNRTYDKARSLAESIGAKAVRFDRLKENLKAADIIISATSSPHMILKKEDVLDAISHQLSTINYKLLIIDLALPRDVDPRVRDIKGVRLFNLDDLRLIAGENIAKREIEARRVRAIIDREVDKLWKELTGSELEPAPLP